MGRHHEALLSGSRHVFLLLQGGHDSDDVVRAREALSVELAPEHVPVLGRDLEASGPRSTGRVANDLHSGLGLQVGGKPPKAASVASGRAVFYVNLHVSKLKSTLTKDFVKQEQLSSRK